MIRFSDRLQALPGYPLAEIPSIKRRLIEAGMDVIDLGAGDNDTPPPDTVLAAMHEALGSRRSASTASSRGSWRYRQAISRWVERRFGIRFDPATETLPLLGSKEGLSHLPLAVVNPGDVVLVPEPGYQAYIGGAILSGADAAHLSRCGPNASSCSSWTTCRPTCSSGRSWCSSTIPTTRRPPSPTRSTSTRLVEQLPEARHPARLRQRLLRAHVRRLSGAEHLRDPGRARRGHRVLLPVQELLDDRLAHRLRGGTERTDRRAHAGQVVRRHRAVAGDPAGRGGGAGQLRCAGGAGARGAGASP